MFDKLTERELYALNRTLLMGMDQLSEVYFNGSDWDNTAARAAHKDIALVNDVVVQWYLSAL